MPLANVVGKAVIQFAPVAAPGPVGGALRRVLNAAINGVGKAPGARTMAGRQLVRHHGDHEAAIRAIVAQHAVAGGVGGFVTNLGGVVTTLASLPANMASLALTQSRMVAAIAHLRGYDLDDPRVRSAVVMCLLGRALVDDLVAKGELPSTPIGVATAPVSDPLLEQQICEKVLTAWMGQIGGKQAIALIGKRVPVIGGGVGAATDGFSTRAVGRYAASQFVTRRQVGRADTAATRADASA
jgi:hypothetical protein